jgi:hypothetical protein
MSTPVASTTTGRRRPVAPLVGALVFLLAFLAVTAAGAALQNGPMPLPDAPVAEQVRFLAANTASSLATGALQGLSALGLAVVVTVARGRGLAVAIGGAAVVALLVSALLTIVLGVIAPTAAPDVVGALRTAAFLTGGVVHVVLLGLFVAVAARRRGWSRPVTVLGAVAAVVAVLSLASTVWFPASVLLPVGRLLCMAWAVTAGVSLLRGRPRAAA